MKIRYGLKNLKYAQAYPDSSGAVTYGTYKDMKGAKSMSLTQVGETVTEYADNIDGSSPLSIMAMKDPSSWKKLRSPSSSISSDSRRITTASCSRVRMHRRKNSLSPVNSRIPAIRP